MTSQKNLAKKFSRVQNLLVILKIPTRVIPIQMIGADGNPLFPSAARQGVLHYDLGWRKCRLASICYAKARWVVAVLLILLAVLYLRRQGDPQNIEIRVITKTFHWSEGMVHEIMVLQTCTSQRRNIIC